jgi:hypothetical protein
MGIQCYVESSTNHKSTTQWVYDTGANTHIITPNLLENAKPDNKTRVWTASGRYEVAAHRGDAALIQSGKQVQLTNLLRVPNTPLNFTSRQRL